MSDLEVKATDLEKKLLKFLETNLDSGKLPCPVTALILMEIFFFYFLFASEKE